MGLAIAGLLLTLTAVPAAAQIDMGSAAANPVRDAALGYANPANRSRVVAQPSFNRKLAEVVAINSRIAAEAGLAALVVDGIARDPGRTTELVRAAVAAAPELRPGLTRRVKQAFPAFARLIDAAAEGAAASTRPGNAAAVTGIAPAAGAAPAAPRSDRSSPASPDIEEADAVELAEADAEIDRLLPEDNDPLEGLNRAIFFLNDTLDTFLFRPIAWTYGKVVPDRVKRSVRSFISNIKTPVILANDVLQGEVEAGGITLARFVINSTLGIGGLFEVAEEFGLPRHDADFGQTLHAYNVGSGPYLMLPVLGPASARDGVGKLVDAFFDPLTYYLDPTENTLVAIGKALVRREEFLEHLDELRKSSVDYYAAIRSLYFQDRARLLRRGKPPETDELDRLFDSVD